MKILEKIKWYLFGLAVISGLLFVVAGWLFLVPSVGEKHFYSNINGKQLADTNLVSASETAKLEKDIELLNRRIGRLTPGSSFLIINTSDNIFRLYANKQVIRTGKCSTGSFIQLEVDSIKSWTFETPKGALTVRGKITNPVWKKPDWAFIEDGLPVPPPNDPSRYERNVLGDFALSLGDGYLIHGTLYQRLLGMPVTHGCVRMNDDDLEIVYNNLQVGSKVFIY